MAEHNAPFEPHESQTMIDLDTLIQCWQVQKKLHIFHPPATETELRLAEEAVAHQFPEALRKVYEFSDGLQLYDGNLKIYPLSSDESGLAASSAQCHEWFKIPAEVVVFANNGSDEHYGIWCGESHNETFGNPVIEVAELFEDPDCMAIQSTDLVPFLRSLTAFFSLSYGANEEVLQILNLPSSLQVTARDVNDELYGKIRAWSDPALPDPNPEPYTRGIDAAQLKSELGL